MGSLYVGDLRADVDEFDLLHIFNATGKISSIHVCRDTETDKSLGYAYVNYCERRSAENALKQLNYRNIKGKSCTVMWSHHAEKSKRTEGRNVFVKNLENEIAEGTLRTHFTPYGVITSCKVMRDETNHSKGFGFVCYATPEEATKAVTELNGKIIITKPLYVAIAQRKEERRALLTQQFVNRQMTRISRRNPQHLASGMRPAAATLMPYGPNFSANIPCEYNPALGMPTDVSAAGAYGQGLEQMSGAWMGEMRGAVGRGRQTQNQEPRRSPGPRMKYTPTAGAPRPNIHPMSMMMHQQQMMQGLPQEPINSVSNERMQRNITRNSQINQSTHFNKPQDNRINIFINNLDINITDEMLEDLFQRFGEISSVKIEKDQYNISENFGFVSFRNSDSAAKAIEAMNGVTIGDHLVHVGYAQWKSARKELVSQRFSTNRPGPVITRSATNGTSAQSPTGTREAWTPKTREDHTVTSIQHNFGTYTDTGIGNPTSLVSNELPLRQRSRIKSSSSHVNSEKMGSVPSSLTRGYSQDLTFEQQAKDVHYKGRYQQLIQNDPIQAPNQENVERKEEKKLSNNMLSPHESKHEEKIQDLILLILIIFILCIPYFMYLHTL